MGLPARRRLDAARRGLAELRAWRSTWDLTDHVQMASLRARLTGFLMLAGVGPALRGTLAGPAVVSTNAGWAVLLLAPMPLIGVLLLWRRQNVGEKAYALALGGVAVLVASARLLTERVGSTAPQDIVFLIPLMLGAVFLQQRRTVVAQTLLLVGASWAVTSHRLAGDPALTSVLIANAFTFAAMAGVIRLLRDLAHHAVTQAKIGEVTDPLTGLLNRRGFERHGGDAWRRRAQQHLPLVLMLIDVDHFKLVNDRLGHAAGDEMLRQLSALLTSTLREGDHAFRLGGEEFAVLARCRPGEARVLAERIRRLVERELPVTVSIGAVEARPSPGHDTLDELWDTVGTADAGLYAAKNGGRNAVQLVGS